MDCGLEQLSAHFIMKVIIKVNENNMARVFLDFAKFPWEKLIRRLSEIFPFSFRVRKSHE